MLVGTIAVNALAVIDPTDSNALAIWVLGCVFQGLGMAIAFIVSLNPLFTVTLPRSSPHSSQQCIFYGLLDMGSIGTSITFYFLPSVPLI